MPKYDHATTRRNGGAASVKHRARGSATIRPARRSRKSSGGRAGADSASAETPKPLTECLPTDDPSVPRPRGSWWRYLRAKMDCLEAGESLTSVNIAKRLNISRVAVWLFRKRNPLVDAWSDAILADRVSAQWGAVKYRMAMVALQGSVQHADQFCKMEANTYANRGWQPRGAGEENHAPGGTPEAVINILCPRPEIYAKAFNEVPTGLPHAGAVRPAALPPASAPVGGQTAYGVSLPTTIPIVPAKVPR